MYNVSLNGPFLQHDWYWLPTIRKGKCWIIFKWFNVFTSLWWSKGMLLGIKGE